MDRIIEIWHTIRIPYVIFLCLVAVWIRFRRQKVDESAELSNNDPEKRINSNIKKLATPENGVARKVFRRKVETDREEKVLPSLSSRVFIFYSTLTGSSERYAKRLYEEIKPELAIEPVLYNIDYLDELDKFFVSPKDYADAIYLFVLPSYDTECPLDFFLESLKETYNDFRIDSKPLRNLGGYSVFGIGDREGWPSEEEKFCYQAIFADKYLGKLGAPRIFPIGTGDIKASINSEFDEWYGNLVDTLRHPVSPQEADIVDSSDEEQEEEESNDQQENKGGAIVDVEDMGMIIGRSKQVKRKQVSRKEMVSEGSPTYKSLTKQGYTIVGSHSGVKICRWTKSALRGRGSCYKFAFYGIKSHLCMETTPSLSCSNKCVFCWRHGTNPVGTTWRWQVDEPEDIIKGAMEGHYKKIKMMKGVVGVQSARFSEALRIRHCALSLVGEPIFYPHINRFVGLLHEKEISSFLVCNAQHPDELEALDRVTQLYVSIDASTRDSLKKIDRPLHGDFWERFNRCLDILGSDKMSHQRTVFRLTLVKGFNLDEVEGYGDLVEKGKPCFIEVKGVTYCGNSSSNSLTMKNVPFYKEIKEFVLELNKSLAKRKLNEEYDIAAEHAHSCCILLAQKRFKINGIWNTHIDYEKFFNLLKSDDDNNKFGPLDYVKPTPEFALFGSEEGGFNPQDERHFRKKKQIVE